MVCGWDSSPIQISNGRGKSPKFLVELTDLNRSLYICAVQKETVLEKFCGIK
jgi:hypothetical protein